MPRFLEIELTGHPEDVEYFVNVLKLTDCLGSDSVNYPIQHGKVKRYLDVIIPTTNKARSPIKQEEL